MGKSIAHYSEWAVLTEGAANQALNHTDGGVYSYGAFWPTLASWYGMEYTTPEANNGNRRARNIAKRVKIAIAHYDSLK